MADIWEKIELTEARLTARTNFVLISFEFEGFNI